MKITHAAVRTPTPDEVRDLRTAHFLTAEQFAEIVYAATSTVYAWEHGRRDCPLTTWELLLIYFGRAQPRTFANSASR